MMARRLPVRALAGELQPKRNNARESVTGKSTVYRNATCRGNARSNTTHKRTSREDRLCDSFGSMRLLPGALIETALMSYFPYV